MLIRREWSKTVAAKNPVKSRFDLRHFLKITIAGLAFSGRVSLKQTAYIKTN
jgi:hypothetical protein